MDEAGDATRRTHLANERTFLAWWRTGLTAFAVSLGVGKIAPDLQSGGVQWPYLALGAGFALLGSAALIYGAWRQRSVERAVLQGRYARLDERLMWGLTAAGVTLGLLTALVVILDG